MASGVVLLQAVFVLVSYRHVCAAVTFTCMRRKQQRQHGPSAKSDACIIHWSMWENMNQPSFLILVSLNFAAFLAAANSLLSLKFCSQGKRQYGIILAWEPHTPFHHSRRYVQCLSILCTASIASIYGFRRPPTPTSQTLFRSFCLFVLI